MPPARPTRKPATRTRALEQHLVREILPPDQEDRVILALARGRGSQGVDAAVAAAAIQAARLIRLNATFLDLAVKGALGLDVDETGDLIFISLPPADTELPLDPPATEG